MLEKGLWMQFGTFNEVFKQGFEVINILALDNSAPLWVNKKAKLTALLFKDKQHSCLSPG